LEAALDDGDADAEKAGEGRVERHIWEISEVS
jgi:hypothetical protein